MLYIFTYKPTNFICERDLTLMTNGQLLLSLLDNSKDYVYYANINDFCKNSKLSLIFFFGITFCHNIIYNGTTFVQDAKPHFFITGCMAAGKTKTIMSLCNHNIYSSNSKVSSRANSSSIMSKAIKNISQIENIVNKKVYIDEIQFMDFDRNAEILKSCTCYFSGLLFTFNQDIFEKLDLWWIVNNCNIIYMRQAICNDPTCEKNEKKEIHEGFFSRIKILTDQVINLDKNLYYISCKEN